jgi:regulator of RNase E activity RraA
MTWSNDQELFAALQESLSSAVIGDVLDAMGLRRQFLPPAIKALEPSMVVVGRALTVFEEDIPLDDRRPPFGRMFEALDDLKIGEVYVASGGSLEYAYWGELMSFRARSLGARGAVLNGYSRDTNGILKLSFPTFSCGQFAQDQLRRGAVVDFRVPVLIGQVRIAPGELLFGDRDGVVIPKAAEGEMVARAFEKSTSRT